jgi:hypothetical protein
MKKSILSKYHVNDEVPLIFKPIFYLYGYGVPVVLFIYQLVVHFTSKIVFIGREQLEEKSNYIFLVLHSLFAESASCVDATSNVASKTNSCSAPFYWCQKNYLGILRLFG